MLVVEANRYTYSWGLNDIVRPLKYSGEIVIVFDPSKTNMAVVIGTPTGDVLHNLEFSGNNRGRGPVMDTTQFCIEVRKFLQKFIGHCSIYLAATEATIQKRGVNYYNSNLVLTEIRANILNFFSEQFGVQCIEVNNWTWKHSILPEGYRGQKEKGSVRFFADHYPSLGYHMYHAADMTDAMCIYMYCIRTLCANYSFICNASEPCDYKYHINIYPMNKVPLPPKLSVLYNNRFSLEDNISYYVNRIQTRFSIDVPMKELNQEYIYGVNVAFFNIEHIEDEYVKVVIHRCT